MTKKEEITNLYLKNPSKFNDIKQVMIDLKDIDLKYNKFPIELQQNILFSIKFFSLVDKDSSLRYISKDFLENFLFVSEVIKFNPDIYFYIQDDNKQLYKDTLLKRNDFMKFYNKEDFNNLKIGLSSYQISNNYKYIPSDIILKFNLLETHKFSEFECKGMRKTLTPIFDSFSDQDKIMYLIYNKNYISVMNLNDNLKSHCLQIFAKDIDFIKYAKDTWTNDDEYIKSIVNSGTSIFKSSFLNFIDYNKYIPLYKDLLGSNDSTIFDNYCLYKKEIRNNKDILLNLFKPYSLNRNISNVLFESIPNKELKDLIKSHIKTFNSNHRNLNNIGKQLYDIVNSYFLHKELNKSIDVNKNKIIVKI